MDNTKTYSESSQGMDPGFRNQINKIVEYLKDFDAVATVYSELTKELSSWSDLEWNKIYNALSDQKQALSYGSLSNKNNIKIISQSLNPRLDRNLLILMPTIGHKDFFVNLKRLTKCLSGLNASIAVIIDGIEVFPFSTDSINSILKESDVPYYILGFSKKVGYKIALSAALNKVDRAEYFTGFIDDDAYITNVDHYKKLIKILDENQDCLAVSGTAVDKNSGDVLHDFFNLYSSYTPVTDYSIDRPHIHGGGAMLMRNKDFKETLELAISLDTLFGPTISAYAAKHNMQAYAKSDIRVVHPTVSTLHDWIIKVARYSATWKKLNANYSYKSLRMFGAYREIRSSIFSMHISRKARDHMVALDLLRWGLKGVIIDKAQESTMNAFYSCARDICKEFVENMSIKVSALRPLQTSNSTHFIYTGFIGGNDYVFKFNMFNRTILSSYERFCLWGKDVFFKKSINYLNKTAKDRSCEAEQIEFLKRVNISTVQKVITLGSDFLIMEKIEGIPLDDILLSEQIDTGRIAINLASSLTNLHEKKLTGGLTPFIISKEGDNYIFDGPLFREKLILKNIHPVAKMSISAVVNSNKSLTLGDCKPSNMLITHDGAVCFIDPNIHLGYPDFDIGKLIIRTYLVAVEFGKTEQLYKFLESVISQYSNLRNLNKVDLNKRAIMCGLIGLYELMVIKERKHSQIFGRDLSLVFTHKDMLLKLYKRIIDDGHHITLEDMFSFKW